MGKAKNIQRIEGGGVVIAESKEQDETRTGRREDGRKGRKEGVL
jgi:hypothetical protein